MKRHLAWLLGIVFLLSGCGSGDGGGGGERTDRDCSDFATQQDAQAYFNQNGGSASNNVDGLDDDRDGIACESLPNRSVQLKIVMAPNMDEGEGGLVQSNFPMFGVIHCGAGATDCDEKLQVGDSIELVAHDTVGWTFDRWTLQLNEWPPEFNCREIGQRTCTIQVTEEMELPDGTVQINAIWKRE